jgi:hypothetical protein
LLAFIDESGHPHPNNPSYRPVVAAACLSETDARLISGRIHAIKRDLLNRERMELKGVQLLNKTTFRRKPDYVEFSEKFFNTLGELPITFFAVIMQQPFDRMETSESFLGNRYRHLVKRIELLAQEKGEMATVMVDGSPNLFGGLGWQFNHFLYGSEEGRFCPHITDVPCFVDSQMSTGIQIADMVASVLRQYEEAELFRDTPSAGDAYLVHILQWYRIIKMKTRDDLKSDDGLDAPGLLRLAPGEL